MPHLEKEIIGIVIAALGGAAVGVDRQRAYSDKEPGAIGGLRTFALMGTIAGASGYLIVNHLQAVGIAVLLGTTASVLVVRFAAGKISRDATTEIAAMAVIVSGVIAGCGYLGIAAALYAWTVLLLIQKSWLHTLVNRIGVVELEAAAQFSAMALIILPILPAGSFGPKGIFDPRAIWSLVLVFSGITFAGYLARKALGPKAGWVVTGLIGGLISSTQVTLSFSRDSRTHAGSEAALFGGVMAASAMSLLRVCVVCLFISPALALAVLPYLIAPFLIGVALILYSLRSQPDNNASFEEKNPLRLLTAVQLALLFVAVQYGVTFAKLWFGNLGLFGSATLLGSADIDALVVSLSPLVHQGLAATEAARAIVLGIISNMAFKLTIASIYGEKGFRLKTGLGLAAVIATLALGLRYLY